MMMIWWFKYRTDRWVGNWRGVFAHLIENKSRIKVLACLGVLLLCTSPFCLSCWNTDVNENWINSIYPAWTLGQVLASIFHVSDHVQETVPACYDTAKVSLFQVPTELPNFLIHNRQPLFDYFSNLSLPLTSSTSKGIFTTLNSFYNSSICSKYCFCIFLLALHCSQSLLFFGNGGWFTAIACVSISYDALLNRPLRLVQWQELSDTYIYKRCHILGFEIPVCHLHLDGDG